MAQPAPLGAVRMIASANIMTDLILSLCALIGLGCVYTSLHHQSRDDPITRRFRFALQVVMLLFAGRALVVMTGGMWFRFPVLLAASLVPLAGLLLAEGLLRRHAPRAMKIYIAGFAALFALLSLWYGPSIDPLRLLGLLIYQISGFAMIGWLVATRDRSTLSMAENQSAGRLGWVLIVLVPLIAADFLLIALRLPVQLSAIGVLILCWVALDLVHAVPRHRQSFARAGGKIAVAAVTGLVIGLIGQMGREGVILAMALTVAMVLVIAIVEQRYDARRHAPQLIAHIATAPMDTPVGFLRDLRAHPWVKDAAIIDVAALAGFQPQVLADIFAQYPVLRRSDHAPDDPVMTDHIAHLFARFDATHILDTGQVPRQLVALAMPALHRSPDTEQELQALQRIIALIAQNGGGDDR